MHFAGVHQRKDVVKERVAFLKEKAFLGFLLPEQAQQHL